MENKRSKMQVYGDMDSFLADIRLPKAQMPDFYIVQYENESTYLNYQEYVYSHGFFEITLIVGYDAQVQVDHLEENILDYNLIFVSPNQRVSWKLEQPLENAKSYLLLFSPEILGHRYDALAMFSTFPFFSRYTPSIFKVDKGQIDTLSAYFEKMIQEYKDGDRHRSDALAAYLTLVLVFLKRALLLEQNLNYRKSRANELSLKFEQLLYVEPELRKPISYYAEKLHISPVYLAECIKRTTQRTFKEIVDECLVLRARSLLKNKKANVTEVADILGFSDRSSFGKYFKKHTGMSPKKFQKTWI